MDLRLMKDNPIGETGKGTAACLWSLLWRTCVLFPLAGIFGIGALLAVLSFTAFPPKQAGAANLLKVNMPQQQGGQK